ncbi:MAG TPA: tetratricopeptide repeat protein, partial [Ktedonobacteraceae bacterium]|nr:tetratricopeptide repeat protein [Ktedonobacteraceae bacterium]
GAALLARLRSRVPSLTCLATSRIRLGLPGEREFPVPLLRVPSQPDSPERLMDYEGVALFVDRAQSVRADFQITPRNAASVAQLCQTLEGLPLAIELVATRANVLAPAQMLAGLSERFLLLSTERADRELRHRSLWTALDWSYRLLSPGLQRFFARLSVFRGGIDLAAARAVCEEEAALDCLAQLRVHSLALIEDQDVALRYHLLESLREFGQEQLAPEERAALRQRHAEYFAQLAEEAELHLTQSEQLAWIERLQSEHDNLRAALGFCCAEPAAGKTGLRIAGALWRFWYLRSHVEEGIRWLRQILDATTELGETPERARVMDGAVRLLVDQRKYNEGTRIALASLEIWQALGDTDRIATAHYHLGAVTTLDDDGNTYYPTSQVHFEQSLALRQELGDLYGIARSMHCLGMIILYQEDYATAEHWLNQSLQLHRHLGYQEGIAQDLLFLGITHRKMNQYEQALQCLTESLQIMRALAFPRDFAELLEEFGYLAILAERSEQGVLLLGAAEAIRAEIGVPRSVPQQIEWDACVALARTHLEPEAYASAIARGRVLPLQQALDYALDPSAS